MFLHQHGAVRVARMRFLACDVGINPVRFLAIGVQPISSRPVLIHVR